MESPHKNKQASTQGHDFIGHAILLGCDHGGGAEDAAGKGDAESQGGIEDGGEVFLRLGPVERVLRIIRSVPTNHIVLPLR